jgi:hypothetical protein
MRIVITNHVGGSPRETVGLFKNRESIARVLGWIHISAPKNQALTATRGRAQFSVQKFPRQRKSQTRVQPINSLPFSTYNNYMT